VTLHALERPAVRAGAGIVLLAAALWLVYGSGYTEYDQSYSLLWGRDLAHGHLPPDFEARNSPTPHPLPIAVGALLSVLGNAAPFAFRVVALLCFGFAGVAAYRLGSVLFGRAAGALAAVVLLSRPELVKHAMVGAVDVPFLACVLWACALEAERPRRGPAVLALLAVAGLLRPEAWLFSLAYAAWVLRGGRPARPALVAALALGPPLLWAGMDLVVTGDALHSLHHTDFGAERLNRPRGLGKALELGPRHLKGVLGWPVLIGGAAGVALLLRRDRRRGTLVLAVLGLGAAAFIAIALADLALLARYLFVPAAVLAVCCAGALAGWRGERGRPRVAWAIGAAALALALGVGLVGRDHDRLSALTHRADRLATEDRDLKALARAPQFESCDELQVHYYRLLPLLAYFTDRRPGDLSLGPVTQARFGLLVAPRRQEADAAAGFHVVARNRTWALLEHCGKATP
jgi:hypothetical protein